MKPAGLPACVAAALFLSAGAALAAERDPSLEESDTLILLEPIEIQSLYGVDEDDDGLIDYLILEEARS